MHTPLPPSHTLACLFSYILFGNQLSVWHLCLTVSQSINSNLPNVCTWTLELSNEGHLWTVSVHPCAHGVTLSAGDTFRLPSQFHSLCCRVNSVKWRKHQNRHQKRIHLISQSQITINTVLHPCIIRIQIVSPRQWPPQKCSSVDSMHLPVVRPIQQQKTRWTLHSLLLSYVC